MKNLDEAFSHANARFNRDNFATACFKHPMKVLKTASVGSTLFIMFALAACGGGEKTPDPKQMSFIYQETAVSPSNVLEADPMCPHHFSPADLTITSDNGEVVRPTREGPTHSALLPTPAAGEHWLYVVDIKYCGERPNCPTPTTGVSINGKALTRQVPVAGSCTAFAFTVSADGAITP